MSSSKVHQHISYCNRIIISIIIYKHYTCVVWARGGTTAQISAAIKVHMPSTETRGQHSRHMVFIVHNSTPHSLSGRGSKKKLENHFLVHAFPCSDAEFKKKNAAWTIYTFVDMAIIIILKSNFLRTIIVCASFMSCACTK